jgi:hypothetical protein
VTRIPRDPRWLRLASLSLVLGLLWAGPPASVAGATPNPSGSAAPPPGPVVVTMEVVDESFRVLLTQPGDVTNAWALLAGEEVPSVPNGRIVYGDGGVNAPWSWQLDPDDFEWADVTTEVCDGKPSDVEAHLDTSDRYCPWHAPVLAVVPVVASFPAFRDTMTPAWALLDGLRPALADPRGAGLEQIAAHGASVADALEAGLGSVLPDICYLDAWRLEWLVAVDLRLVADLWSAGQRLYAEAATERLAADLAARDEALGTIGCD